MPYQPTSTRHSKYVSDDKKGEGPSSLPSASIGTNELEVGARKAYDRLRSVGMTVTVTFEGFLAVYSLGSGGGSVDAGRYSDYEELEQKAAREKLKGNGTHGQGRGRGREGGNSVGAIRDGKQVGKERNSKGIKSNWRMRPLVDEKNPEEALPLASADRSKEKGSWQEALDVLSERLVGRREVARVRANILALRGSSVIEDPMKEAENELERLYRGLGSVKKEWELESGHVAALHGRERNLAREVENQRRVLLLLNVLEKREIAKMKRISTEGPILKETDVIRCHEGVSIADLVKSLRVEATSACQNFQDVLSRVRLSQPSSPFSISVASRLKGLERFPDSSYKHTKNVLANLHAYHSRLTRLGRRSTSSGTRNVDDEVHGRLEKALTAIGVVDVRETRHKLVAVAKLRAERKRKSNQVGLMESLEARVDEGVLDEMQARNERKKMDFENSLKTAVALGWVCEGYIDMILTFCTETASQLEAALEEERKRVEGHVDKIKADILKPRLNPESTFGQEVRKIMKTTRIKVWEEVEELLKRPSLSTNAFQLPAAPSKSTEQDILRMDVSRVSELLERKLQKAKHGYTIAQEIRTLLDGHKKLKYI